MFVKAGKAFKNSTCSFGFKYIHQEAELNVPCLLALLPWGWRGIWVTVIKAVQVDKNLLYNVTMSVSVRCPAPLSAQ